jgi:hypothetical protein
MKQYEYKKLLVKDGDPNPVEALNTYGNAGWRVIHVQTGVGKNPHIQSTLGMTAYLLEKEN